MKFEIAQLKNGNYFALKMYRRIAQDFMMQQPGAIRILVDDFASSILIHLLWKHESILNVWRFYTWELFNGQVNESHELSQGKKEWVFWLCFHFNEIQVMIDVEKVSNTTANQDSVADNCHGLWYIIIWFGLKSEKLNIYEIRLRFRLRQERSQNWLS